VTSDILQSEMKTTGKDKIIEFGGYGNVTQGFNGNLFLLW
jgi:hypothetical protein